MSYTPGSLNDIQKKIGETLDRVLTTTKCKKILDVKEAALVKPQIQKNVLAGVIENLVGVLDLTQNELKIASTKMEELQSELITNQKSVIKLQEELISNKSVQFEAVQSTVKTEMRSFADIVKEGSKNSVTKETIHRAVKLAVSEDQRHRNLVIFGLKENSGENLETSVNQVIRHCSGGEKVTVKGCHRIGNVKPGSQRAVKVCFESRESATSVLAGAKELRQVVELKNVFISPDRSPEERAKRRDLVAKLKEKIHSEPGMYHFIQNGKLVSAQKRQSLTMNISTSTSVSKSSTPRDGSKSYLKYFDSM